LLCDRIVTLDATRLKGKRGGRRSLPDFPGNPGKNLICHIGRERSQGQPTDKERIERVRGTDRYADRPDEAPDGGQHCPMSEAFMAQGAVIRG